MRRGSRLVVALAIWAAWGLGWLPQGTEPEERRPVTVLAFDGGTRITALTGVRATEAEEAEVLSGTGSSVAEACGALRGVSSRKPYLGQVEQVLIGEGQRVDEVLELILRDGELNIDTLLYMVKGNAGAALTADAPRVAQELGGTDPRGVSAGQVLSALSAGERIAVPVLGQGEHGLTPDGWALLGAEGLTGYLENEAALGTELLLGLAAGRTVALFGGTVELAKTVARVSGAQARVTLTARSLAGNPTAEELEQWGTVCLRAAYAAGVWGEGAEQMTVQVTGRLVDRGERG